MTMIITTMEQIPEHCYDCPLCDDEIRCKADTEKRNAQDWRPFWCPLQVSPFDNDERNEK